MISVLSSYKGGREIKLKIETQWHIEEYHVKMEEATGSDTAMKQSRSGTTKSWKRPGVTIPLESVEENPTSTVIWAFKDVRKSTFVL